MKARPLDVRQTVDSSASGRSNTADHRPATSHLAIALGGEAAKCRFRVRFVKQPIWCGTAGGARRPRTGGRCTPVLIIDELGFVPVRARGRRVAVQPDR